MNTLISKLFLTIFTLLVGGFLIVLLTAIFNTVMANDPVQDCADKGGVYERGYCIPRDMTDAEIQYAKAYVRAQTNEE